MSDGCTTTIHGTVWDPGMVHPVYNALVYVPTTTLDAIPQGPTCDPCSAPPSGNPLAVALSGPDGTFSLGGVPAGTNVPLVVQVGKWRRETGVIPSVVACSDNAVPATVSRLPASKAEGHIPHIAISTGLDSMECALESIGISATEFTDNAGAGSIHIYQGSTTSGATAGTGTEAASALWASTTLLGQYDMIIDACQGQAPTDKPQANIDNINAYAAQGGRLYLSHYEDFVLWPTGETSAFSPMATQDTAVTTGTVADNVTIDLGFPKGNAMAQWAVSVGASTTLGLIAAINNARNDVLSVTAPTKGWLPGTVVGSTTPNIYQASFYAGATPCGKVHYADYHVSAGSQAAGLVFPAECATAGPDPGANDLFEFFLLDALSCVQDDSQAPVAPPP
jgi:hypothetical protein